ncbi:hypothetical protein Bbelb_245880 [Branchiostoma belcheri]|nr:hypothetical protein Bbelb_245880 [Branchiostoma belcheri]
MVTTSGGISHAQQKPSLTKSKFGHALEYNTTHGAIAKQVKVTAVPAWAKVARGHCGTRPGAGACSELSWTSRPKLWSHHLNGHPGREDGQGEWQRQQRKNGWYFLNTNPHNLTRYKYCNNSSTILI